MVHKRPRWAALVAMAALAAHCGDDDGNDSGGSAGNGSGDSGGGGTAIGDLSASCRRVCEIAFQCAESLPGGIGGGLGADAARTVCLESCNQSIQDIDEGEITQACLTAAEASLSCLEAADCDLTLGGDACADEQAAVEAACPQTSDGEDCDFDCGLCSEATTRATCEQAAAACTDAACCLGLTTTFAQCGGNASPVCNFDCTLCSLAERPLCEQALATCAPLSGSLLETCCSAVETQLATTCGE